MFSTKIASPQPVRPNPSIPLSLFSGSRETDFSFPLLKTHFGKAPNITIWNCPSCKCEISQCNQHATRFTMPYVNVDNVREDLLTGRSWFIPTSRMLWAVFLGVFCHRHTKEFSAAAPKLRDAGIWSLRACQVGRRF